MSNTKRTVTATFSDGTTVSRNTSRPFTHAFRTTFTNNDAKPFSVTGFASSAMLAAQAGRGVIRGCDTGFVPTDLAVEVVATDGGQVDGSDGL